MLIRSDRSYVASLRGLWHRVFGDEEDYINLIFPEVFDSCDVYAQVCGEEIVSAFYLLGCKIRCGERVYTGKYLYAAATLPPYRNKGIMSSLIREALAGQKDADFIALVPADEGLYGYYSRFGFLKSMYRYSCRIQGRGDGGTFTPVFGGEEFARLRENYDGFMLSYNAAVSDYAFACLEKSGNKILRLSDRGYCVLDCAEKTVREFISADKEKDLELLCSALKGTWEVHSPYDLSDYGESRRLDGGMIYAFSEELKKECLSGCGIYMNIALD